MSWIKLHRQFKEWEWYTHAPTKDVFIHLLLSANIKEKRFRGDVVPVGSIVTGRKALADQLGLSEQQIRTALKNLQSTNEITIQATNAYSIISVVKWGEYQGVQPTDNQPSTNDQPATNHQSTTPKEYNNNISIPCASQKPSMKIKSIEEIESHPLDGEYQAYFEEKCPDVNIHDLRDDLVQYCQSQGKTYKDYWATLQTWGRRKQKEIIGKLKKEEQQNATSQPKLTKSEQKASSLKSGREKIFQRIISEPATGCGAPNYSGKTH